MLLFFRFKENSEPGYDITIVGGGIVGIATAMKLAEKYPTLKLAVVEKENQLGKFTKYVN